MRKHSHPLMAVVIDHNNTKVYHIDDNLSHPLVIEHKNEYDINRNHLRQKNSHFQGQRVPEDHTYYEEVAKTIKEAKETLIISHGKGKSSAGLMLLKYLSSHHHDVFDHIVGLEAVDELTDHELLHYAEHVFHDYDHRKSLGLSTH